MMRELIDLTMPLSDGMPAYPGEPTAAFESFSTIEHDSVAMSTVHLFSQIGTHVDAPCHFLPGGRSVDQLDLAKCVGPAAVVRLGPLQPGEEITADRLAESELIDHDARIIIDSGWEMHVGTAQYFRDWPTFTLDAVEFLVARGVVFVGLDTPSPGTDQTNIALHQALFRADVVLAECLINTHRLPDTFRLACLPLPLVGLDGSPARVIAQVGGTEQ